MPRAWWNKPAGRKLLAGDQKVELYHRPVWEEERGSGTAQGQPSTPSGLCPLPLSHGFAAFAGENTEPMCASE